MLGIGSGPSRTYNRPPPAGAEERPLNAEPPRIRLFVMDVDGTLTDGTITYTADGVELKSFHARDGAGIKLLPQVGIVPAIVSGRASAATRRRAKELGIETVYEGVADKHPVVDGLREEHGLAWEQVAAPEVRRIATYVCTAPGGRGAVREAIEHLLRAQGDWDQVLAGLGAGA